MKIARTCKASKKNGHSAVPCNAPACAIARDVFDEKPYDVYLCEEHLARYRGRYPIVLLNEAGEPVGVST